MNTRYDVAIIGCGEAGIFAGYELMHRNPGLKVVTLDQGADIYTRSCPIVAGKVKECIHCKVCDTMCGFGGAGAFSDEAPSAAGSPTSCPSGRSWSSSTTWTPST